MWMCIGLYVFVCVCVCVCVCKCIHTCVHACVSVCVPVNYHLPVGAVIRPGVPIVWLPWGLVNGLCAPFMRNTCGVVLTLSKVGAITPKSNR